METQADHAAQCSGETLGLRPDSCKKHLPMNFAEIPSAMLPHECASELFRYKPQGKLVRCVQRIANPTRISTLRGM